MTRPGSLTCRASLSSSGQLHGNLVVSEEDVVTLPSLLTTSLPRGRGGRSSFSGNVVTVFGSSGTLARLIINRLGKSGCQIIAAYRGEAFYVRHLKLMGDLGQVLFCPTDLRDQDSLMRAVKHSNIVINLIGANYETTNFSFNDVHADGARAIARACRESGVSKLLHFSSINAAENPRGHLLKKGSQYLRSKWLGEVAVREEFPDATIFRPADFFGPNDGIFRHFARRERSLFNLIGLYKRGEATIKQPIHSSDIARAAVAAILDRDAVGQTYNIAGPDRYLLSDLIDWMFRSMRKSWWRRIDVRFQPNILLSGMVDARHRGGMRLSLGLDMLERECVTDAVSNRMPTARDLGVNLIHMADTIDHDICLFRKYNHYEEVLNEFAPVEPAPTVS